MLTCTITMKWPLKNFELPHAQGRFGVRRKHDRHTGVDLYCDPGEPVYAMDPGVVVQVGVFTGEAVGSPWWNETNYVAIRNVHLIIVYGEISSNLQVGDHVVRGQKIGRVVRVLKHDKGLPTTMLHLELYNEKFDGPVDWSLDAEQPESLENIEMLLPIARLDHHATIQAQALQYMKTRAYQLLIHGYQIESIRALNVGLKAIYRRGDEKFASIYTYQQDQGFGWYKFHAAETSEPIITINDCNIESYLVKHDINYVLVPGIYDSPEYKAIERHYGDREANRSKIFYMQHIDEGLRILSWLGSDLDTMKAFCLHPLFQADEDLVMSLSSLSLSSFSPQAVIYAMEYRQFANAYLSKRTISSIDDIALSPLKPVNDMLIADKVQNFKDLQWANTKHPRYEELKQYFENWHKRLGIKPNSIEPLDEFTQLEAVFETFLDPSESFSLLPDEMKEYVLSRVDPVISALPQAQKAEFVIHMLTHQFEKDYEPHDFYVYELTQYLIHRNGLDVKAIMDERDRHRRRNLYVSHEIQELVEHHWDLLVPMSSLVQSINDS